MVSFDELPIDILIEIFSHLDLNELRSTLFISHLFCQVLHAEEFWRIWVYRHHHPCSFSGSWKTLGTEFDLTWACGEIGLGRCYYHRHPIHLFDHRCKEISAGHDFSLALDQDGQIWSAGSNLYGQLGVGCDVAGGIVRTPLAIPDLKAKTISAGCRHALFIDYRGRVWCCGENFYGQLGLGKKSNRCTPKKIPKFRANLVAAGLFHSLYVDPRGDLWGSGHNLSGELGIGFPNMEFSPVKVPWPQKLFQISARGTFSLALDEEGSLWVTGSNRYGQLGLKDNKTRYSFQRVEFSISVKRISAGTYHSMILDQEDRIWVSGYNGFGQLGLGLEDESISEFRLVPGLRAREISAGGSHSLIIDWNGEVWGAGSNIFGQLTGTDHNVRSFRKLSGILKAQKVAAGNSHSTFIGLGEDEPYLFLPYIEEGSERSLPHH